MNERELWIVHGISFCRALHINDPLKIASYLWNVKDGKSWFKSSKDLKQSIKEVYPRVIG